MMSVNMRNWLRRRIWISSEFSLMCQSLFAILGVGRGCQKSVGTLNLSRRKIMNKRKIYIIIGLAFILAACLFVVGTVNHILNTEEGIVSSVLLALGCICAAIAFLRKK